MTTLAGILRGGDGALIGTQIRWQPLTGPTLEDNGDVVSRSVVVCESDPETGEWTVDLEAGDWLGTWVVGSMTSEVTIRVPGTGSMTLQEASTAFDQRLKIHILAWAAAEAFTIVDLSNLLLSSPVVWPDGRTGTYTCTVPNEEWSAPDAFTLTYVRGGQTLTVTQALVTRDAEGVVTVRPELTIS